MATTLNFKAGLDLPQWRPNAPFPTTDGGGASIGWDMRNDSSRNPIHWLVSSTTTSAEYNPIQDEWMVGPSFALSAVSAGATVVFHPSQGPRGTLTTGSTTTTIVLSTALPAAVGANTLADRGDGVGYRIRVTGKSAAGSGKINERNITANTAGTTPTLTLDVALDWTPASGDGYELLSGRLFALGSGAIGSSSWKYYDVATGFVSAGLATTNLAATIATDSQCIALSECHVSCDRQPSTGFLSGASSYDPAGTGLNGVLATAKNCCVATATSATTLTGSGMPADLQTNEYRNFQIRIVEDTTNPTGVGQRAQIASHTSGATGVFTVASWPVITPSATAKYVIENNDDLILMRSSATVSIYTYKIGANTWDTTSYAAAGAVGGFGNCFEQAFGIVRDPSHNRLHGHMFFFRGAGGAALDLFDISAGTTGVWTAALAYIPSTTTFTTGTCCAYDPVSLGGKTLHINVNGTQRFLRFNMLTGTMEAGTYLRYPPGVAGTGVKMALNYVIDGAVKLAVLHYRSAAGTPMFSKVEQF